MGVFTVNGIKHVINDELSLKTIYNQISTWETNSFKIIEKCSDKNKVFIDIGAHIGVLSIHGAGLFKNVYSVECDSAALKSLKQNMIDNEISNNTIINRAIYFKDNEELNFGGNGEKGNSMSTLLVNDPNWNQGANWLIENNVETAESIHKDCELIKTITLETLLKDNQINPNDIGLIKIDIEGGEKYIFETLKSFLKQYRPNLFLSLHYVFLNEIDCHKILLILNEIYNIYDLNGNKIDVLKSIRHHTNECEIFCTVN